MTHNGNDRSPLTRRTAIAAAVLVAGLVAGMLPLGTTLGATARASTGPSPARSVVSEEPATPELIEEAVAEGEITEAKGALLLTYAFIDPGKVPDEFVSDTPWSGTLPLWELRRSLPELGRGPNAVEARRRLKAAERKNFGCPGVPQAMPKVRKSKRFYVQYQPSAIKGLGIGDYMKALNRSWKVEVQRFGWAAPPKPPKRRPPGGRYPVKLAKLGPALYGYVAGTHPVKDNPALPWKVKGAWASCMVLNQNFRQISGPAFMEGAMQATIAHEFNHSLQFGYGGFTGSKAAGMTFVEGGATWMESEVFPEARDNEFFLWPDLRRSMLPYNASPYPYWVVYRAMLEPFGVATPAGGQEVFRIYWELISKRTSTNLVAMDQALAQKGSSLAEAFHDASVAIRFYSLGCEAMVERQYCLVDGPGYPTGFGTPGNTATIGSPNGTLTRQVRNNFATAWIGIPSDEYDEIKVSVASGVGRLRVSAACRQGNASLEVEPAAQEAVAGGPNAVIGPIDLSACDPGQAVVVIANVARTSASPKTFSTSNVEVSLTAA